MSTVSVLKGFHTRGIICVDFSGTHWSCTEYFLTISVVCCDQPVIMVTSLLWPFLSQKNAKIVPFSYNGHPVKYTAKFFRPVLGRINGFHCIRGG